MKPSAWDDLDDEEKRALARNLLTSVRGSYIIGQALTLAKRVLRAKDYPEESNAQDMEILQVLFFPYEETEIALKEGESNARAH